MKERIIGSDGMVQHRDGDAVYISVPSSLVEITDEMVERASRAMAAETWKAGYFRSQADHVESEWKLLAPLVRIALTAALQPLIEIER